MKKRNQSNQNRNVRQRISYLVCVCILLLSLSGCKVIESISEYNLPKEKQLSQKKENAKEAVPPSEFRKTEITLLASTFKSLNPYAPQDKTMETILKQCYQGLMTMSASGEMVGQLADEVLPAEDTMSCIVTLGDKKFHDDGPVGYRDVNYSWQKAKTGKYAEAASAIKKISPLPENKIKIEFVAPGILNLYSLNFPIVPENSLEKGNPLEIRGTGPYRLAEYTPMQSLKLKSEFNQLEVTLSRTENIMEQAFLNGRTDIYYTGDFPWFTFSEEILKKIFKFPSDSFYYMGFRLDNGIMADGNIRKYLVGKLDLPKIYKNAFLNHIIKQKLPFHKARKWEVDLKDSNAQSTGLNIIDTNPIELGQKLRLIYPSEDKYLTLMAENVKNEWQAYVGVEIVGLSHSDYNKALQAREFDVYLTKNTVSEYWTPKDMLGTGGKYNYSGIGALDQAIHSFIYAKNEEEQKNTYLSLIKEIESNVWMVPFGFLENAVIFGNQVEGHLTSKTYDVLSGITEIKVIE